MAKKQAKITEKHNVALQTLIIEYLPIDAVKPNDYNPNRQSEHDFELLCKSIDEDGMTQPIVALRATRVIVDGEHRWRACKALGYTEVPVVLTDMNPAQARIATLRHNRARGEENVELAAAVLRDLVKLGATEWLKDSLSMDEVELQNFMESVDHQDGFTSEQAKQIATADDAELRSMVRQEGTAIDEHASVSVQDVIRAREQRLSQAKDDQEKAQIDKETDVYRLRLVFTGMQAEIIRRVLGKKPIDTLLEICRSRKAATT